MVLLTDLTKEVLSAILKSIDEGIHVVNTKGETIFYNEVAAKHDGMTIEEVLGRPLLAVFPSLTENSSTLLKVIRTKKPIYNQTQLYKNVHGLRIETINTTLPIFLHNEIIGAVEIAKDYSKIKLLAEHLLNLQKSFVKNNPKKTTKYMNYTLEDLLTVNKEFLQLKQVAQKLAKSNSPILVYGESGTGKEILVQGIHQESHRSNGPFIAQNCAAIPEALLESLLFGASKGSYTGAVERKGLFELADEGTLFLDELHTMPIELQAKLLRVLEDGAVRRIGGTENIIVNVRIIAAMNLHPIMALQEQKLREDLFYRLNVFTFSLPPLRERKEDIPLLTHFFIQSFNQKLNKKITGIDPELESLWKQYPWPGNVRELKHLIEYMMNVCESKQLEVKDLPGMFKQALVTANNTLSKEYIPPLKREIEKIEKRLIDDAMKVSQGNINLAAKLLVIPRQTLQYKLRKYSKQ